MKSVEDGEIDSNGREDEAIDGEDDDYEEADDFEKDEDEEEKYEKESDFEDPEEDDAAAADDYEKEAFDKDEDDEGDDYENESFEDNNQPAGSQRQDVSDALNRSSGTASGLTGAAASSSGKKPRPGESSSRLLKSKESG